MRIRRVLTVAMLITAASAVLFAAGQSEAESGAAGTGSMSEPVRRGEYGEAPTLAAKVESGELPPVEERLPQSPMVLATEEIGKYGGTLRTTYYRSNEWLNRHIGHENLLRWNEDGSQYIANLAESWDSNPEGTVYTFNLRRGVKWSDGHPFTADDILFWYEDLATNEAYNPGGNLSGWAGGFMGFQKVTGPSDEIEPGTVTKVNDYTVRIEFAAPNGLFLRNTAAVWGLNFTRYPKHYLSRFHPRYNSDVAKLVEEGGFDSWVELMRSKMDWWSNSEVPTTHAWILEADTQDDTTVIEAVRNPYYWKTDAEGNQLPYIDRFRFQIADDGEVRKLSMLGGEVDFNYFGLPLEDKALFVENQERGDYSLLDAEPSQVNSMVIALNLNHKDPVKREIFQNKDFRIGLSHAIDREEIIDLVFLGQGRPFQTAPRPGTVYYDDELAAMYLEFDPKTADEYLDRAGYTGRDRDGFRLGPDGERISFEIEVKTSLPILVDALELIKGYWENVGIETNIRQLDDSVVGQRLNANLFDARTFVGTEGTNMLILDPFYFLPFRIAGNIHMAVLWANWYEGTTPNEVPPAQVRRQLALYDELKAEPDPDRQDALMSDILEITKDQFYTIGISLPITGYGLVSNRMRNVPDSVLGSWLYFSPAPVNPQQFWIEPSMQ